MTELEQRSKQKITTEADIAKWRDGFAQAASDPRGDTAAWVQVGVKLGYSPDTPEGRQLLAQDMGTIFAFVYDDQSGTEIHLEDINWRPIQQMTGIPHKRLKEVAFLMVATDVIKSKEKIKQLERERQPGYRVYH